MGHFVFVWRRGEKPRLFGPFANVYQANRCLHRFDARDGYYTWVVQPEELRDEFADCARCGWRISRDGRGEWHHLPGSRTTCWAPKPENENSARSLPGEGSERAE